MRDPDLLTRKEAAELLGVKPSKLERKDWGPAPLPQYSRPVYYSRQLCTQWLKEQREAAWAFTKNERQVFGGAGSRSRARRSDGRLARQVAERLRQKSAGSERNTNAKHLVAVGK